ncbi:hypothetical protein [Tardiphaga sp.]|jgi:hypothetical protein|uniref:DUF7662 domain-containing protein n=1 Tax=Tardiphaga sp. TaxID=1926292 RepID=UPI0037D995CF
MSVYDPLRICLEGVQGETLALSFTEIEALTGRALPKSAHEYNEWWSNEDPDKTTHTQSRAWTTVGFDAEVDRGRQIVTFRRRQA